jgi:hypothetical protein
MNVAIGEHIDWPLFNAIVSKHVIKHKSSPVDLQVIRTTFDTFHTQSKIFYIGILHLKINKS